MARRRDELTDKEWLIIEPLLPNKPRGVPRADDRRVLNGILWRFRSGAPWAEIPERYGPSTTCYNRFVRWRKAGVWDRLRILVVARSHSCVMARGVPGSSRSAAVTRSTWDGCQL